MYRIGEFSTITNLSVKTLRYYDVEGLLCPSSRTESGYRLYNEDDFARARRIALLRSFDFSIAELRDVLAHCADDADLRCYLLEKQAQLAGRIAREQQTIAAIDRHLAQIKQEEVTTMTYHVEEKQIPAQSVLSVRHTGAYGDCGPLLGPMYREAGGKAAGAPFHLLYDNCFRDGDAELEICLPVRGAVRCKTSRQIEIPACRAVCVTHTGPYNSLNLAYKAAFDYMAAHGLKAALPTRLIYEKGPGMLLRGNPNKYVTHVIIPIKE